MSILILGKTGFIIFAVSACLYAAIVGGRPGRWGLAMFLAAAFANIPASSINPLWIGPHFGIFAVDLALLAGLIWLTLRSNVWWPIWATGFHMQSTIVGLAQVVAPMKIPYLYRSLEQLWSGPVLLSMVIGIYLDSRLSIHPVIRPRRRMT